MTLKSTDYEGLRPLGVPKTPKQINSMKQKLTKTNKHKDKNIKQE